MDLIYIQTCLVQVSQTKDLGVWLTDSLTPTLQCQKAANKAMQVMGMIRRSFKYLIKLRVFFIFVQIIINNPTTP